MSQQDIESLQASWVWAPGWIDSSDHSTAGRIVHFSRTIDLKSLPTQAIIHCSADTRYKLIVNGRRITVGPARSSTVIWYYDTIDLTNHLHVGQNVLDFVVLRYFACSRAAMPFERTAFPGFTCIGKVVTRGKSFDLDSRHGWQAQVDNRIQFPTGLIDDVFLHISERVTKTSPSPRVATLAYDMKTLNGDLLPWRLQPRCIPPPEETEVVISIVKRCESSISGLEWQQKLRDREVIVLPANSTHIIDLQAEVHSTAFLQWVFRAKEGSDVSFKAMYSEGYELEPRNYPFFRTKQDRLDVENGKIIGPFDQVELDLPRGETVTYEPFWFRTFRLIHLEIKTGKNPVELASFAATQTNYPMSVKAEWHNEQESESKEIWDTSIRTMRNCMFDGYSDCPFYEQLQYSCDSRSVGLFHYLLSGDDRLMRQAITNFGASVTPEGLTQSRFPSHVRQVIAGFSLYWILQVCDHHLFFGDTAFSRAFLPRIDGVLEFFANHVGELGLVTNLPSDTWQYVDWVTAWGATETHPDKGVPVSGRANNTHTYFTLLYSYVLQKTAGLLQAIGRTAVADEYLSRSNHAIEAVKKYCYDGRFFTDSTADIADELAYSQHCQVFAVLAGAADRSESVRLLQEAFDKPHFHKCSYMMRFYAFRAFSEAGDELYESKWNLMWQPYRDMLRNNLTTWEEDDVRQRSDCHAWGSVPIYEYCTELAGIQPLTAGCSKVLFKPRLNLSTGINATIALGRDNIAQVSWTTDHSGKKLISMVLDRSVDLVVQLPDQEVRSFGTADRVSLEYLVDCLDERRV